MYQWLFQLNNNYGSTIDENNSISIISKENEGYELEKELQKNEKNNKLSSVS